MLTEGGSGYHYETLLDYLHLNPLPPFASSALGGVLAAGVLFSVFNALFKELIFRGIWFDAVESQ